MGHNVRVWSLDNGKWRASVDWQGERLFGEAEAPALAIVELGSYWESRAREEGNDMRTLAKVMLGTLPPEQNEN